MSDLLGTKLHQPAPPPQRIRRPHLVQRLNEGLAAGRQVTLVSAPAGFGKTTCASEWVQTLEGWPVAWLSLDPADDDPARFVAYFIAALQKVDANLGREIAGALQAGQLPPGPAISTALINDILDLEGRLLLVLDDFQVIQDPFILQVLEQLITNLPPPLHLVLLTREDPPLPLARLRGHNQLTEIRARDLRFTRQDAADFLNGVMGLSLSAADVDVLETKTEGWIAGLQLAALAVRDRADPARVIHHLSGSHRFILSYLTEQVLDQQLPEIRTFLLQTAILDRLHGDLCDAVSGRSDSRALLEQLFNANLFLVPLDDEGQWYRYHHLFADLLRGLQDRLEQDEAAGRHRRAAQWYARAGDARGTFASEAIQHALAAQDYGLVVDLLERHAMGMIMQGYAKTVNGWVQAIPEAWEAASPRTDLAFAWMHLFRGAYAHAQPHLERVQALLSAAGDRSHPREEQSSLEAEWLVMQTLLLNMQGRATDSKALATRALELAPETDHRVRSLAYWGLAGVLQLMEDYTQAMEAYRRAIQHGRAAENLVAEMMSTAGLALMAYEHGRLRLAFELTAPVIDRLERSGALPPISAVVYGLLGQVHYQWYELAQAQRCFQRTLQFSTLGGYQSGLIFCRVLFSRLSQLEGDLETADRRIQEALDLLQPESPEDIRQEVVAQQVRVCVARHRLAVAEMALQAHDFVFQDTFSFPKLPPDRAVPHPAGLLYNSSLRLLLYQVRAGRDPASLRHGIELADRLIAGATAGEGQYLLVALEALLLRAQMCTELGETEDADTLRALELAGPEGFIAVFVEQGAPVAAALARLVEQDALGSVDPGYVQRILATFAGSDPAKTEARTIVGSKQQEQGEPAGPEPALVEPLTEREMDVLRLMAEGLKYKEIAARLFISLNTVRFHVKAIYGKLAVNNRTQAIQKARGLRIL